MDAPSDEKLLHDFVAGDVAGFELLVRRYAADLFRFATRLTGSSALAEDVVQESLLKVYLGASSFDPLRKVRPWLFTVAANKARDLIRRQERNREVSFEAYADETFEEGGKRFLDLMATDEVGPREELSLEEKRRLVRGIINTMPTHLKEALILAYYHHFSYKDLAEILEIQSGTVKSRVHKAITHFGAKYRAAIEGRVENDD